MEIIFRIYKPNFITIFDPLPGLIGWIFSEGGADDDNVVEVFIVFFFNQL